MAQSAKDVFDDFLTFLVQKMKKKKNFFFVFFLLVSSLNGNPGDFPRVKRSIHFLYKVFMKYSVSQIDLFFGYFGVFSIVEN